MKKYLKFLLSILLLTGSVTGCAKSETIEPTNNQVPNNPIVEETGWYSSKEDVAEYIEIYGELPDNYLTKDEARELGWDSQKGNLWDVADGMSIGGDRFGNREGLLPDEKDRVWYECDIDYEGGYRNDERIVFSNDGLIYYTDDHYESFEEIIGE